jgi:hypothetical protein
MEAAWLKEGGLFNFDFCIQKGGVLERDLKERGINIEITVPLFLPLPSQTCCRREATAGVKAWIVKLMYCMLCTW